MTPDPHASAYLARLGFRAPATTVGDLPPGWFDDPGWRVVLKAAGASADPDAAIRRLVRLGPPVLDAVLGAGDRAEPLLKALGFSEHIAEILARTAGLAAELLGALPVDRSDLRERRDAGIARIAVDDLSSPPTRERFEETGRALSGLADDLVDHALRNAGSREGLAVLAMGKYGGRELNYASDIDVLFVADGAPEAAEPIARGLMQALNGPPTVIRVDADLRPEGRDGPLVRSLEGYAAYYARWAQVWEFQALIKCRLAAGDDRAGRAFLDLVEPFVWPEVLAPEAIEQIRALKARAEREIAKLGLTSRQVKLAPGGIRDVEFAVQLLQLVHGRHHPELRGANTLAALDTLGAEGFVAESDAADLGEAYVFLRHVEHRLQLVGGRQTHTLPTSEAARELLARGMGYRTTPDGSALEHFERDLRRTTTIVRQIHEKLFYRPLLEAFAGAPTIAPSLTAREAEERLAALGFDRPPRARAAIAELTVGGSRRAKIMRAILPGLLAWLAETPDPDAGILRLADLVKALAGRQDLLAILRDEPPVAELVCRALGTGPVLAELIQRDPAIIEALERREPSSREELVAEASSVTRRSQGVAGAIRALRRFKEGVFVRAAGRDLTAGNRPEVVVEVGAELSHLADACLETALSIARAETSERTGGPPPGGFAIVAMGRFGGRELSYASDLDVMYVYERDAECPDGSEARLFHSHVAERVSELLSDSPPIFRVDPEVRPEGRNGPIVRSLDSYARYYERWASTWEFQALTRARHAAGDEDVTRRLLDAVADRVWPPELRAAQITEIRHMKARIERERVGRDDPRYHVKLGTGGLADVEFTVQLLQMRHGHARPDIRTPNTLRGIEALGGAGIIERQDAAWLRDAYLVLNRVRNHLFLLRGLPTDSLPPADEDVERLARSLGYGRPARSRFLEDYRRVTRRARRVCDRLFYGEEEESERN